MSVNYTFASTPFGEAMVAATDKGVCALFFADTREEALADLAKLLPEATPREESTDTIRLALRVLEGGDPEKVPLDLRGTPFQKEVWRALTEIPRGTTTDYGAIAEKVGRPRACRAVGSAVGANPVSVIVPCHRVVRKDGALGGFRWGVDRKKALLKHELKS
ncbi:MAG: methylated-DNA--[protein]-cysteine S-methyltransferase [Alistipes sp.]|jgi:AraC family transcriptional regulator of adaptative response/methylated-DNA-[protein]-cysteine methyltransferase|nr:methylated-DNA--[protein]-cysteine S-methyltransferase [Alistipes sp.]